MVHLRHRNLLQTMAATIFPLFYRRRAARKRYFRVLSSPRGAETIFLPFYRHRAAREQYFCRFIVVAQRGNNTFAVLSSPCSAGTIFSRFIVTVRRGNNIFVFYRRRAARQQYFCVLSSPCGAETIFSRFIVTVQRGNDIFAVSVLAVLLQIHSRTVLTFAVQLRAFRNVARTARGWRRASCRGENEKQPFEME